MKRHHIGRPPDWAFWVWALVGAALALSAVSLGPLLYLPVLLAILLLTALPRTRSSAWGLPVGVGALLLFIAYLQRGDESLDARPWLGVGLVAVAIGVIGDALSSRRVASGR